MAEVFKMHDIDFDDFIKAIDSCKGDVFLETADGDVLNLKSKLCQIVGLTTILNISVPILNAIYPSVSIIIIMGLFDDKIKNPFVYPVTIGATAVISVVYALEGIVPLGVIGAICSKLPFYAQGFGWLCVTLAAFAISIVLGKTKKSS